ncbi:hypothetical protein SAMN05877809_102292 [Rhodobacter sp. JA431]|nr:hypothetical protein SAMN05877809_102292 [Rhodobacter sp. JA431]
MRPSTPARAGCASRGTLAEIKARKGALPPSCPDGPFIPQDICTKSKGLRSLALRMWLAPIKNELGEVIPGLRHFLR